MGDAPDEVMFQEKGVFFSNCLETIRAHQALANRFLSLEGKGGAEGGAQEFTDLGKRIDDLGGTQADLSKRVDELHSKLDKLFPDESAGGESQPVPAGAPDQPEPPPPQTEPKPETPAEAGEEPAAELPPS